MSGLQKRGKVENSAPYLGSKEIQEQAKIRVLGDASLVDRYINEETHVLCCFRCRDGQEFAACFQKFGGDRQTNKDAETLRIWLARGTGRYRLGPLAWRHCTREIREAQSDEQVMLVDNVKLVESPEIDIPTLVWVDTVELLFRQLMNAPYFSRSRSFILCGGVKNWESSFVRRCISGGLDQFPNKVVEGGPKIVNGIPCDGENVGWNIGNLVDVKRYISGLRVFLAPEYVWVVPLELVEPSVELVDVLVGPVALG